MKVDTVEQYKVLEYIKNNFHMQYITLKILDSCSIEVTDNNKDTIIISYTGGKIIFK